MKLDLSMYPARVRIGNRFVDVRKVVKRLDTVDVLAYKFQKEKPKLRMTAKGRTLSE